MFKISLIRPNYYSHLITPPLGLGYLSSYLKSKGYNTKIIDGLNLSLSNDGIVRFSEDADLVCITCLSDFFSQVIDLSLRLKNRNKIVVIGGAHATALPEFTLKQTQADFVVVGEGEKTLFELVQAIEKHKSTDGIRGVLSSNNGKIRKREFLEDLNQLPFPDWSEINPQIYKKAPHGGLVRFFPVAPIITTRGCPYECTFCASPKLWDRNIRYRNPENVVEEIEFLKKDFGIREIHFEDDNFTLNRKHITEICELLIKKEIKISWACPNGVRVDQLDKDLLLLMKRSGCYFLAFGIESANQEILDNVRKKTKIFDIENVVKMADKLKIVTQGFFIFGLPGETKETISQTIRFAKRIPLDKAQFLLLDILPGSQLWNELKETLDLNWNRRSYQEVTWIPDGLKKKDLEKAQSRAFRTFFLRPRPLLFFLRYFKISQLPFIFRRIKDFGVFSR